MARPKVAMEMLDALQGFFTGEASLWSLLIGSFIAATLIPISSEVMLFAVLRLHPELFWPAIAVATLGNSAGGMVSYAMGRYIPHRREVKYEAYLKRHGPSMLLLAWVPLVGDALCIAAGWLRLAWLPCLLYMAVGKAARYLVVAGLS
jgi:membrane protein YqaA with SNARE-associated domain